MKKLLISFLVLSLSIISVGAVDLYVDTNKVETDTPPAIIDGRTLVPVRAIFEAIGATVTWDGETRTATGIREDTTVSIQIENATAYVNGEEKTLDVPAQIINGRTMVPARFISESMGCAVSWYGDTQTVGVSDKTKGQSIYVTKTGSKYHYSETCNGGTYYETTLAEAMGRKLTPCEKCVLTGNSGNISNNIDVLLGSKEHVRFYFIGINTHSDGGIDLKIRCENDSDYKVLSYTRDVTINGKTILNMANSPCIAFDCVVEPGRSIDTSISIGKETLDKYGITEVKTFKTGFAGYDVNKSGWNFEMGGNTINMSDFAK